jgi:hypothetical protein
MIVRSILLPILQPQCGHGKMGQPRRELSSPELRVAISASQQSRFGSGMPPSQICLVAFVGGQQALLSMEEVRCTMNRVGFWSPE